LIDALAKIAGLRVASRTSAFALKGKSLDVRAVGALLGTSVVLEGTVRKRGIAAYHRQLTSTDDAAPLVAGYDRTLPMFRYSGRNRATIVNTLRATMFADVSSTSRGATPEHPSLRLYLKGRYAVEHSAP